MQSTERILTAHLEELHPAEQAAGISCTVPGSEPKHPCPRCRDSGWLRIDLPGNTTVRQCECRRNGIRDLYLVQIPARFRNSSFDSFKPRDRQQERVLSLLRGNPRGRWYLHGAYGSGKTHLLYAQYRVLATSGQVRCHVRTSRELVEELRRAEFNEEPGSPIMTTVSRREAFHLFWDDIDKLKLTDFKMEVLLDLVDCLYRHNHGLTVTSNFSMRELVERERMPPAVVRRLDDMCTAVEL
jgi:DNA replication protein DnaC